MTTATVPLQDLAQRISEQEAELARLRDEFGTRRRELRELTRQKQSLQKQLEKVEMQILGVSQAALPTPMPSPSVPPASIPMARGGHDGVSLPKFLVSVVQQAKGPITVKELSHEVVRRKFPSKSKNLAGMVETRVSELVRSGILRRLPDKGLVPGKVPTDKAPAKSSFQKPSKPMMASVKPGASIANMTLKDMILRTLQQSSRPLTTGELAEAILKTGYETKSKDFKNVIWVGIGAMKKQIERVPGVGYCLKGSAAANRK